jgi:hypothetical protein
MKITLKSIISSIVLGFGLFLQPTYAVTIAGWSFESLALSGANTNTPPDGWLNNIVPETGSGIASGFHATTNAAYSVSAGNSSSKSISANRWSVNDYYQFAVSAVSFKDITLSYDQIGSSAGPASFQLTYSTNGMDFATFGFAYTVSSNSWTSVASDLSSITDLNNQFSVIFRVMDVSAVAINGGAVAWNGADRIDNFIVAATLVPEPALVTLGVIGGLTCLIAGRRKH